MYPQISPAASIKVRVFHQRLVSSFWSSGLTPSSWSQHKWLWTCISLWHACINQESETHSYWAILLPEMGCPQCHWVQSFCSCGYISSMYSQTSSKTSLFRPAVMPRAQRRLTMQAFTRFLDELHWSVWAKHFYCISTANCVQSSYRKLSLPL